MANKIDLEMIKVAFDEIQSGINNLSEKYGHEKQSKLEKYNFSSWVGQHSEIKYDLIADVDYELKNSIPPKYYRGMDDWYVISYVLFDDKYSKENVIMERIVLINFTYEVPEILKVKMKNGEVVSEPIYNAEESEFWETLILLGFICA